MSVRPERWRRHEANSYASGGGGWRGSPRSLAAISLSGGGASAITVLAGNLLIEIDGAHQPQGAAEEQAGADQLPRQRLASRPGTAAISPPPSARSCWSTSTSRSTRPDCRPAPSGRSKPGRRRGDEGLRRRPDRQGNLHGRRCSSPNRPPSTAKGPLLAFNGPSAAAGATGAGATTSSSTTSTPTCPCRRR